MAEEPKERETPIEPTFILGLKLRKNEDGTFGWDIKSKSTNIPDEMIISLVRFWLKAVEDKYYDSFKKAGYV